MRTKHICKICNKESGNMGMHLVKIHKISVNDYVRQYILEGRLNLCLCGCGTEVPLNEKFQSINDFPRWVQGHYWKSNEISEETRKKMSESAKVKTFTEEHRKHMGESSRKSWENPLKREKASKSHTGKKLSQEHCEALSLSKMSEKNPFYGKKHTEENIKKVISALMRSKRHPNKLETASGMLIEQILPSEYKYTGKGDFILANYCPDFVNINGQKKIIEIYGDYWHCNPAIFNAGDLHKTIHKLAQEIWKNDAKRIETFKQYGYDTLVIWEHELKNPEQVKHRILDFNNK